MAGENFKCSVLLSLEKQNPQFSESLSVGKNLEVQLKTHHSQIPILNLWMNWKKLYYF